MHELSIATSILDLARQHTPAGAVLRSVSVRAGAMRGIEPHAMEFAWLACTQGTEAQGSQIKVEILPWKLQCPACGTEFTSDDPFTPCQCGQKAAHPAGGKELQVVSIEVDEKSKDEG